MKRSTGFVIGYVLLGILITIRVLLPADGYGSLFSRFFSNVPTALISLGLLYGGFNLRKKIDDAGNFAIKLAIIIFMSIAIIEAIVWYFLTAQNYGLQAYFVMLFFLPFGFFFGKEKSKKVIDKQPDDIFELYDQDESTDDIFAIFWFSSHIKIPPKYLL